jgi:hypothetical protein
MPARNYGEQAHSEERRAGRRSEFAREKLHGLAEQDFTAALFYYAATLPRAQEAAGSESGYVRGIRQFFIGDIQFDATGDVLPDHLGQTAQYTG